MRIRSALVALFVAVVAGVATTPSPSHPRGVAGAPAGPCAPPTLGFGVGEGANDAAMPPTTGDLRIAMLFVDFADAPARFSVGDIAAAYAPAVRDWAGRISYRRLRLSIEPLPRWLRLPRTFRDYDDAHFDGMVEATIAAADPHYDFSSVDALYLITSTEAGSLASTVVDHDPLRVDGTPISVWVWFAAGSPQTPRSEVLIHETGHVLGLPDLYDVRRPGRPVDRRWDVMAAGDSGELLAWHRWKLGWLDPAQVACLAGRRTLTTTLAPLERPRGRKAAILRMAAGAVVVEVRRHRQRCRSGVLVYRVDFRRGAPASAGTLGVPVELALAPPGRTARCGRALPTPYALRRGAVARTRAFGVDVRLLRTSPDGSYRVRVTRRR